MMQLPPRSNRFSESPKGFTAQGYLDTNLYVFPEQEMIVVRMQSKPVSAAPYYEKEALPIFNRMIRKRRLENRQLLPWNFSMLKESRTQDFSIVPVEWLHRNK